MKYGHHEVTHPDQTHEEMEVEEWAYKFLIGKAGSELRHIQNNYKVKVNIPRPHSECQNVVIVGGVGDVSRAKDYIDNLMWKAQNQPAGGRGQDAAIDPWGEEEEEDRLGRVAMLCVAAQERVFVPRLASLALGVQAEPFRTPRQMFSLEPKEAARLLRRAKSEAEEQLRGGGPPSDPGVGARVPSLDTAEQQELWLEIPAPNFSDDELATGKPNRPRHCPERPKKEWREEEKTSRGKSLGENTL
eukprot:g17614.t1